MMLKWFLNMNTSKETQIEEGLVNALVDEKLWTKEQHVKQEGNANSIETHCTENELNEDSKSNIEEDVGILVSTNHNIFCKVHSSIK